MPSVAPCASFGPANARYVISCRRAKWRSRFHVRSLPPLSSGSRRSDFSHRMRIVVSRGTLHTAIVQGGNVGKGLHALPIDERAVPQLQVEKRPDALASVGAAGGVVGEQVMDGLRLDEDRKSTRLNSSHSQISYAVFC